MRTSGGGGVKRGMIAAMRTRSLSVAKRLAAAVVSVPIVATNADGTTAQLRRVRMDQPLESELLASSLVADRHDEVYEAAIRAAAIFLAAARPAEEAG